MASSVASTLSPRPEKSFWPQIQTSPTPPKPGVGLALEGLLHGRHVRAVARADDADVEENQDVAMRSRV